jgi:hypothetical protein
MQDTVTINRTIYRVQHNREDLSATIRHGYLHGPRGALAIVVQARETGAVIALGASALQRMRSVDLKHALRDVFDFAEPASVKPQPPARSTDGVHVNRDGLVTRHGRPIGWVDRYDHTSGRRRSTWRWVLDGGRQSTTRFTSRSLALDVLLREGETEPRTLPVA